MTARPLLVVLLTAVMTTAAVVVSGPVRAAPAPVGPSLDVGDVQALPGTVDVSLSGRGLPAGVGLADAGVRARAGTVELPTRKQPAGAASVSVRAVVLVIDASGSMAADLPSAKAATRRFVRKAPAGVWFGLVTISDHARVLLAPTADRAAFDTALADVNPGGGTALYAGIDKAAALLADGRAPTAGGFIDPQIVVLSDGIDNTSTVQAVVDVGTAVRRSRMTVTAIVYGDAERPQLAGIAEVSGGQALASADAARLDRTFARVAAARTEPLAVRVTVPDALRGTAATLQFTVVLADGTVLRAARPVTFPGRPPTAAPGLVAAAPPDPHRWGVIGLITAVLAVFLATLAGLGALFGRTPLQRRLHLLRQFTVNRQPARNRTLDGARVTLAGIGERITRLLRIGRGGDDLLDRAAVSIQPSEWVVVRLASAGAGALIATTALPWWAGLPLGAVGGHVAPDLVLRQRITRRGRAFADELPEVLQLIVSSLRSGFTLQHAIEAAVRDGDGPAAAELRRALSEVQVGGDLEDALERVGRRIGSADVRWLVMAIRLHHEVGGNLAEVLQTTADTMRERAYLRRHVRGLSAEGRLSAYILMALPIALAVLMAVSRPAYIRPLFTEPLGLGMLAAATGLMVIGAFWLRAAVRVDV